MNSTILVVDSDESIRTLMKDILGAKGHRVETASGVGEAGAILTSVEPDLVFAACELDDGCGGDILITANGRGYAVPLILLVDALTDEPVAKVRASDAFSFLKKPIDRAGLEMAVHQGLWARGHMLRDARQSSELSDLRTTLSTALQATEGISIVLDPGGIVVESGGPISDLFGSGGAPRGSQYITLLPEQARTLHAESMREAIENRDVVRIEEHRGGLVLETVFRPVLSGTKLSGILISMADITERRRSQAGLADSEKRYRNVFNGAVDAVLLIERQTGLVRECNKAAERVFGYSHDELLCAEMPQLMKNHDRIMQAMKNRLKRIAFEHLRRKDGTLFPVELAMNYFLDGGTEVCVVHAKDVSGRKIVEEALREGARLYRAVVEDQTELICRYDPDGELAFVNSAYARFFGEDEEEVADRTCFDHLGSLDKRTLSGWLDTATPRTPVLDREIRQIRSDGELRWIHWTDRAMFDDRGELKGVQAVGRDVTERKDAEKALAQATREKEQYRLNLVATFKSIPDAILTVDSDMVVIASNRAAAKLLAFDKGRMRGIPLVDLLPDTANPCISVLKQVLETSKPVRGYEIELETPSLGERMMELNCTPLVAQEGAHNGAVLIVRDVSHIADLEKQLQKRHGFRGIVGSSSAMQDVYQLLEQLSSLESIVLILGESGTGKELVAEALHHGGVRAGKPLVKVNCSALSESLLESELFGHVRGAFTGAVRDKVGRIQAAQGGTLFLDEIGDISPLLQLKLLRFLESKEYERVGESKTCTADVRIIAATNVDLLDAVRRGIFREDLYYRLNVMPVSLPPLRERQGDIPLLVEHFLGIFSESFGKPFDGVAPEVLDLFMRYSWPGNVRELRHTLEHACILSPGKIIALKHLRKDLVERMTGVHDVPGQPRGEGQPHVYHGAAQAPYGGQPGMIPPVMPVVDPNVGYQPQPVYQVPMTRKPGREEVLAVLDQCGGNKVRAAKQLGIHRATLYRKLKAWGLGG